MISKKNRKGQMQMSVGTIVTIVLLMAVLGLGLVLVRTIFSGAVENIDNIDQSVKNEISKLFAEDDSKRMVVFPSSRKIVIDKTDSGAEGFAFSINNVLNEDLSLSYTVEADSEFGFAEKCGQRFSKEEAESWLVSGTSATLPTITQNSRLDPEELVLFDVGDDAPGCTIPYILEVKEGTEVYTATKIFLTVE